MMRLRRFIPWILWFCLMATPVLAAKRRATAAADVATSVPRQLERVIVVFKTHFDIGYTAMAAEIVDRYRTSMIDKALEIVDESAALPREQQFVWTIPGWPLHQILDWPDQTPERRARVEAAFRDGHFAVHALPFTLHTELLETEDVVRGLGFSSSLARRYGLELPRAAKMTDVPEHTWMMATLLDHAGVKFLHLGTNNIASAMPLPRLFWWAGPDGSRVLTMYVHGYGTELVPPPDWPCKTWLALIHTGDNAGPPKPESVRKIFADAARLMPRVKVSIGRMEDFADAIAAEKPELPVLRGDAPDTWIHGPMSDPAGMRLARATRPRITETEGLNTQLRAWGVDSPDAAPAVAAAWEQSLLYGEHTWGGSRAWLKGIITYGEQWKKERAEGRFQRLEASWEEHTDYIRNSEKIIGPELEKNMAALARAVGVNGPRVVVYNPLPWARGGVVRVRWPGGAVKAIAEATNGSSVRPAATAGDELSFIANNIPAMGYRTYLVSRSLPPEATSDLRADPGQSTIENELLKITIDARRGTVRSMIDKRSGRELVDAASSYGFGQYLYERFSPAQLLQYGKDYLTPGNPSYPTHPAYVKPGVPEAPYEALSPEGFKVRFERSPVAVCAVLDAPASPKLPAVTTRLTLHPGQPWAELELTLHDKPLEPLPEAGWLCLPLKADAPQYRLGRVGSIVDPAVDLLPGSNRTIFALNTGLAVFEPGGRGVGVCPLDAPLISLGEPGCWKFTREFAPKRPTAFVNLFNNQWTTNFRFWNAGTWTYRVRVWAFEGEEHGRTRTDTDGHGPISIDAEKAFITPALEARYPLEAAAAAGAGGALAPDRAGLELSRKGVLVTAFGKNPDGAGTVLRLWEQEGKGGECRVRLPEGMKGRGVQPVDLRGRARGAELKIEDGAFTTEIKGYAPASFVIQ